MQLDERRRQLRELAAPDRTGLFRAKDDNAEPGFGEPLGRFDRGDDSERSVEAARGRHAVEVGAAPHAGLPAAAVQVARLVDGDVESGVAQPAGRQRVRRVFLRGVARAVLRDRMDLVEPLEHARGCHLGNARSTCQPASGNRATTAKPTDHELAPTRAPNRAG